MSNPEYTIEDHGTWVTLGFGPRGRMMASKRAMEIAFGPDWDRHFPDPVLDPARAVGVTDDRENVLICREALT